MVCIQWLLSCGCIVATDIFVYLPFWNTSDSMPISWLSISSSWGSLRDIYQHCFCFRSIFPFFLKCKRWPIFLTQLSKAFTSVCTGYISNFQSTIFLAYHKLYNYMLISLKFLFYQSIFSLMIGIRPRVDGLLPLWHNKREPQLII